MGAEPRPPRNLRIQTRDVGAVANDRNDSKTAPPPDAEWLVNQIAHTLRNPIFAAMVQAESLLRQAGDNDRLANAAALVHKQLKRLENNIDEMLLYGRQPKIAMHRIQPAQILERLAEKFRRDDSGGPAEVMVRVPPGSHEVQSDPEAISIILERLIRNSVQHTPEPHKVWVDLAVQQGVVMQLTVHDQGEGVSDAVKEKMFLPFYPQHSGRAGLGLSVAAKFAHALGGKISITSQEGKGTKATVLLPVK